MAVTINGTTGIETNTDTGQVQIGASDDLKLYHTGSQSRIENTTGELRIQSDTLQITDKEGNDMHIECNHDGNVELYYDNAKKLETTATGATVTGTLTADGYAGIPRPHRNLIINGSMQVMQRLPNDGTMQTGTDGYTIDRWNMWENTGGVVTWGQSTDAPPGFRFSHHVDVAISGSMGSGTNNAVVQYQIEDIDLVHLKFGTADAKNLTLSFWVKSKQTGTYAIWMRSEQNTSRAITKTYTVSAADTWEKKTINYAGDTSGGGIYDASDANAVGLKIAWCMATDTGNQGGTGSTSWHNEATNKKFEGHNVNVMSDAANYFKLGGVQLEVGDTATEFEHLPYATELINCERYYQGLTSDKGAAQNYMGAGFVYTSDTATFPFQYRTPMRAIPSISQVTGTNYYIIYRDGGNDMFDGFTGVTGVSTRAGGIYNNGGISSTAGHACGFHTNSNDAWVALDAEI